MLGFCALGEKKVKLFEGLSWQTYFKVICRHLALCNDSYFDIPRGQRSVLQDCDITFCPVQGLPLCCGVGWLQYLYLVWVPPPQVLWHILQLFHELQPPLTVWLSKLNSVIFQVQVILDLLTVPSFISLSLLSYLPSLSSSYTWAGSEVAVVGY